MQAGVENTTQVATQAGSTNAFSFSSLFNSDLKGNQDLPAAAGLPTDIAEIIAIIGNAIRPIYYIVLLCIQIYGIAKSLHSIRKKGGELRRIEKIFNVAVAFVLGTLALMTVIFPPLLMTFALATYAVSLVRDVKSLAKYIFKNKVMQEKIDDLNFKLSKHKKGTEEYNKIFSEIDDHKAVMDVRNYKIAQRSVDVTMATLGIVGAALALATGPVGLAILGAVIVVGISVKIGIAIHKKRKLSKGVQERAKAVKTKNSKEFDRSYHNSLRKRFKKAPVVNTKKQPALEDKDSYAEKSDVAKPLLSGNTRNSFFRPRNVKRLSISSTADLSWDDNFDSGESIESSSECDVQTECTGSDGVSVVETEEDIMDELNKLIPANPLEI